MCGFFRAFLRETSERIPSEAFKIIPIYEFDDVRLDPIAFRVTKAGQPVALEPKAFEVLLFLLDNPGRLIEKKELLERVWPDTVVTESAMTRVIADLRKALGDPAREARYIETVPTRGYRFIADVRKLPDDAAASPTPPDRATDSATRRPFRGIFWLIAGAAGLVVLLVGVRAMLRTPSPAASAPRSARQLTDSLGLDLYPSFSPDGAQIAYCSDRGSGFEIFVKQLAAGGREIQITSDGLDNLQPAWSPDGREIAFASRSRSGIWVMPALGGTPRRLTGFGSRPAWSPDGAAIAFQSMGLTDVGASAPAAAPPSSLFLVPATGGTPVGPHASRLARRRPRRAVVLPGRQDDRLLDVGPERGRDLERLAGGRIPEACLSARPEGTPYRFWLRARVFPAGGQSLFCRDRRLVDERQPVESPRPAVARSAMGRARERCLRRSGLAASDRDFAPRRRNPRLRGPVEHEQSPVAAHRRTLGSAGR